MKTLLAIAIVLLAGCTSTAEYKAYADAHSASEVARYKVLSDVAASGSDTAKVAAVMAMALGDKQSTLRAPEPAGGTALQWLSILLPSAVQAYGINANMQLGVRQSDNSASVARSTNDTMTGIAKLIQAPGAITTTTDRHDTVTPAPVVVTPTPIVTPVVQVVPVVSGK